MTITAAADGSALGNPGPAGWAWYIDDDRWAAGGWPHGTNNQGELQAVLELFRATEGTDEDLVVMCDSQYVINALTKWMAGWKRKNWRKADGKPVLNVEILKQLDEALQGRRYRFEWVKGHAGHGLNEAADKRARGAAEAYQRKVAPNVGPGFGGAGAGPSVTSAASRADRAGDTPSTPVAATRATSQKSTSSSLTDAAATPGPSVDSAAQTLDFDALFAIDDEPELHEIAVHLDENEHARLTQRAREAGVGPVEFLRSLI